jgi:hypothetical protein
MGFNPTFFKIVGPVISNRDGYKTIKIELDMEASDWLCKAAASLVQRTVQGSEGEKEFLPQYEQLQQEIVKAWEAFHP